MSQNKVTWEEILNNFNQVEQDLTKDNNLSNIDKFLKDFSSNFILENGFKKWQILEAKERIKKILTIIEDLKKDLQNKKVTLMENRKKLD